jgi:hypothetical protein
MIFDSSFACSAAEPHLSSDCLNVIGYTIMPSFFNNSTHLFQTAASSIYPCIKRTGSVELFDELLFVVVLPD